MFSIDGHNMIVVANDFVPIIPYDTQGKPTTKLTLYIILLTPKLVVTLGIGQRTDVIVKGLPNPGTNSYLIRSSIPAAPCSASLNPNAYAILYYGRSAPRTRPTTTPWPAFTDTLLHKCHNVSSTLLRSLSPVLHANLTSF